ncbi:MAG: hypothetical protein IKV03_00440 [Alphaproteobacteria bacterium]|nr:hypothetical protein [Alphaproteobacteria bacterium]
MWNEEEQENLEQSNGETLYDNDPVRAQARDTAIKAAKQKKEIEDRLRQNIEEAQKKAKAKTERLILDAAEKQKQEGVQPQTQVQQEDIGGQTRVQAQTQEPTLQQLHVNEPELQPKQGPQPQMPNWEMVGVGKTEILADSKEAFKKAHQDKREAALKANKKTSPKPQAPNQEEQKLRDFAAWEKEVEEAIAKAVAKWRERGKANVSDEEKVKTEQEAQQKPQPPRTSNTSQEYSYDLNFNSSRDVHLGQNGAMKIDFSTPAPKPNVPSGQTTDMQQMVQSNGQKQPISYMKKQFFNKGGSR